MAQILNIPIFPLGTVLFPARRLPLRIFEPRYVEMTRSCIADGSVFGVCLIKGGFETGTPAVPWEIGCTARIVEWAESRPSRFSLVARGESVFRIVKRHTTPAGLVMAQVVLRDPPEPMSVPERHEPLIEMLQKLILRLGPDQLPQPHRLGDAAWVGYRLAESLPVAPERRQALLEMRDPSQMLDRIAELLQTLGP